LLAKLEKTAKANSDDPPGGERLDDDCCIPDRKDAMIS
jgi:hypothetical protein